jgi:hypothetical protein
MKLLSNIIHESVGCFGTGYEWWSVISRSVPPSVHFKSDKRIEVGDFHHWYFFPWGLKQFLRDGIEPHPYRATVATAGRDHCGERDVRAWPRLSKAFWGVTPQLDRRWAP